MPCGDAVFGSTRTGPDGFTAPAEDAGGLMPEVGDPPRPDGARPSPAVQEYAELDVRFGWQVRPTLELSLVGQNLLHDRHREFGAAAPTRVLFGRGVYARTLSRF